MSNARSLASFLSGTPTADFNFDSNSLVVDISENTVGIGDTTPDGKLEVRQTASADILNLYDDTTNVLTVVDGGNVGIGDDSPDGKLEVRQSGTDDIFNLYDDTTNVLTVVDGGKVGIGTSTPDGLVDIRQSGTDDILNLYDGTDNIFTVVDGGKVGIKSATPDGMLDVRSLTSDDIFNLYDGSTNVFTVIDGGRVGIGTTAPSEILEVEKDQNAHTVVLVDNNTADTGASAGFVANSDAAQLYLRTFSSSFTTSSRNIQDSVQLLSVDASGGFVIASNHATADMSFWTNDTQRVTIDGATGNVGIGTTAPGKLLHLEGVSTDGLRIGVTGQSYYHEFLSHGDGLKLSADSSNAGGSGADIRFDIGGSQKMRILKAGHVEPGANNTQNFGSASLRWSVIYAANALNTSDRNEKREIEENKLGLDFINALKTKSYKFKENKLSGMHYGLIAQDIENVLNKFNIKLDEYAPVVKDKIIDENKNERFIYSLAYNELLAPIIKSVQELSAKNDALSVEIASLKTQGNK